MHNYTLYQEDEKGIPANVPMRHYLPSDRIALAQPVAYPLSMREAVPGINVPAEGETWQGLTPGGPVMASTPLLASRKRSTRAGPRNLAL